RIRGVGAAPRARARGQARAEGVPRVLARGRARQPLRGRAPADRAWLERSRDRGLLAPLPLPPRPRGHGRDGALRGAAPRARPDRIRLALRTTPHPQPILGYGARGASAASPSQSARLATSTRARAIPGFALAGVPLRLPSPLRSRGC